MLQVLWHCLQPQQSQGKAQQVPGTECGVSAAQAGRAAGLPLRLCSALAGQVLEWKNSSVVRSACATQGSEKSSSL